MPPKKAAVVDTVNESAGENEAVSEMTVGDLNFLLDCLRNPGGETLPIDIKAVAAMRDQKNHRSIANRLVKMRKKYNLPLSVATAISASSATGTTSKADTSAALSSSKNKVTKTRAKPGSKKSKKALTEEDDSEGDGDME